MKLLAANINCGVFLMRYYSCLTPLFLEFHFLCPGDDGPTGFFLNEMFNLPFVFYIGT